MARKITDYNGTVIAPGGDYPNGNIKDDPSGTRIDSKSNGDIQQFFQRMLILAGVTANSLPDNVTNGYQLVDAVLNLCNAEWNVAATITTLNASTVTFDKCKRYSVTNPTGSTNAIVLGLTGAYQGNEVFIVATCNAGDAVSFVTAGTVDVLTGTASLTMSNAGKVFIHLKIIDGNAITPKFIAWVYNDGTTNINVPWTNIAIDATWSAGSVVPQYRVDGNRIQLRGNFIAGVAANSTPGTIPANGRPVYDMICNGNFNGTPVGIIINASTGVITYGGTATSTQAFSIDNIAYTND